MISIIFSVLKAIIKLLLKTAALNFLRPHLLKLDKWCEEKIGIDIRNISIFKFPFDIYIQALNLTNNTNVLTYFYRTKIDRNTGDLGGVERFPVPMFPLIITGGLKFEF